MSKSSKAKIPDFLSKCYAMVDDPSTDTIISWASNGASFVIWDVVALEKHLLPKYYKHNHFSSFIRQLNQYGFKKYDPDRWEFTNDWFIKGQKHILANIVRKKSSQSNSQQNKPHDNNISTRRISSKDNSQQNHLPEKSTPKRIIPSQSNSQQSQSEENDTSAGACVEVGNLRLWEEVEILKKDKNVVMQELAKLGHHQEGVDGKLHLLGQQLEGMEISQQQMLSFLSMVVQNPGFLGQLLQQNESAWRISETTNKRRYLALEEGALVPSDSQIVRYQPLINEKPKPLLALPSNCDERQQFDPFSNGLDEFFRNIDPTPSEEDTLVPLEENGHSEDSSQIVIPDLLEDGMLERLLASPKSFGSEESQTLDRLTEELKLLISETNSEDGENENNCGSL